jgi:hypothetical protein
MATFWERAGGVGDGASEPLVLDDLRDAFIMFAHDLITLTDVKAWVGLTVEQGAEFANLFEQYRPSSSDITYAALVPERERGDRRSIARSI